MKKKVYIAGPMTGYPQFNRPAFFAACDRLLRDGLDPVNPVDDIAEQYHTLEEISADARLLECVQRREIHALRGCMAIYLLRGWQNSVGARAELAEALELNMEIMLEG